MKWLIISAVFVAGLRVASCEQAPNVVVERQEGCINVMGGYTVVATSCVPVDARIECLVCNTMDCRIINMEECR